MDGILFFFTGALIAYVALLAIAGFAPPKHKRFLFFVGGVPIIFLLFPLAFLYLWQWADGFFLAALAAFAVPVLAFLASFYQFFIKEFSGGLAAAAVCLQLSGIFCALWYMGKLISCLA